MNSSHELITRKRKQDHERIILSLRHQLDRNGKLP